MTEARSTDPPEDPDHRAEDTRHAAAGGGTNFLTILAGLLMPVYHGVITRMFGAAIYGVYSLALGISEIAIRLAPGGTDKGLIRQVSQHRVAGEETLERRALATAFWLTLIVGGALGGLMAAFAELLAAAQNLLSKDAKVDISSIRYLAPSIPFAALVVVLISGTMGAKVLRFNLYVRGLALPVLLLICAVPVGLFARSIPVLCLSNVAANLLAALLAMWAAGRVFDRAPLSRILRTGPPHWEMVRFALPLGLGEFLNALLTRVDLIILSLYLSAEELGIYAAAEFLSRVISNARYAFDPVASPVLAEALRQNDQNRLRFNLCMMTRWVTLLMFPIVAFMITFRIEMLSLFGPAFSAGATAFMVLCAGHLFNGLLGLTGWVLVMSGRSGIVLANNFVGAIANVALSFLLIPRYGTVGAAVALAGSVTLYQVGQAVQVGVLNRVHAFDGQLLKVLVAGSVTLALGIWGGPDLALPLAVIIPCKTLVLLTVYGALLALLGLAPEERDFIRRLVSKIRRR